ncbi:MAG: transporter substrate-binding domain-containing protein [Candidatus Brocadiaceae bacterium]|nr:transporter substrate-binding domain-containing protein [Candidatus Brocadiaceae bacterium]
MKKFIRAEFKPDCNKEIGKKLQLKIEYIEEVGWDSMIEAIKSKRVDLICTGVRPTTEKG